MAYIRTVPPEDATGTIKEIYEEQIQKLGYIPNYHKVFSLRPEVSLAWRNLQGTIRSNMRLRRFELVTFAAALALKCRYWLLVHGALLRKNSFSASQLIAIIADYRNAGLDPQDVAVMALAEKVILDQHGVSQQDINGLLAYGLKDDEVLDIVLTAAARSFYTKVLDALGTEPDDECIELEPELKAAIMNVGSHP
jgi:uncharacterized peroxidase-related enzyme